MHTLAAALVTAMTGTALPTCRLRADTARPISESVAIVSASGWTSTRTPSSPRWSLSALIETSDAPQSSPALSASGIPCRYPLRPATAAARPSDAATPAYSASVTVS